MILAREGDTYAIVPAMTGTLFVVGTPIGNLEDITLRALRVLKDVDLILAEDTRVTKKLLSRYEIKGLVERFDAAMEGKKIGKILKHLQDGFDVVLVTDAGTPSISDPGFRLVQKIREEGISVVAVPGPSAITAALSIAGVPADQFIFFGFPPHKKGRKTFFERIVETDSTAIFFESPHRILKTLATLSDVLKNEQNVTIARELTKIHEEVMSGTAKEVLVYYEEHIEKQRGEFVIIVS